MEKSYITAWAQVEFEVITEPDPDDAWDRGNDTGYLIDFGVTIGSPKGKNRWYSNEQTFSVEDIGFAPKSRDRIYMVFERYASGDTFGHTDGNYKPVKLFKTREEAQAWVETPEANTLKNTDYFGGHEGWEIKATDVD